MTEMMGMVGIGKMAVRALVAAVCIAGACRSPVEVIDPEEVCGGVCWPAATWAEAPGAAELGWSESGLERAREYSDRIGSDAVMIVDRGLVVATWGRTSRNHWVQSARKSFLSVLYGMAVEEGTVDLTLDMEALGIDDLPPSLTETEKRATLEQLLQARSGIYHEAAAEAQSMKDARPARGSHLPGTFWYYNNWDFNALGTAWRQLTGEDIFEALYERIAVPLGMRDFAPSNGQYFYEPVSVHPAYHFTMSARDMARFGLLLARDGEWNGQRIIDPDWIARSTQAWSDATTGWDYGYMWWVAKPSWFPGNRMFAALGGAGHAIFVFPDIDLVVVHRVDAPTFRYGWTEVDELLDRILAARG